MDKPVVADTKPIVLDLQAGSYWWCSCGKSAGQPYCDGSHKGSGFAPQQFTLEKEQKAALCLCKQTGNPPYCDGSHAKL